MATVVTTSATAATATTAVATAPLVVPKVSTLIGKEHKVGDDEHYSFEYFLPRSKDGPAGIYMHTYNTHTYAANHHLP